MKHSYFRQLGMRVHTLAESERTHTASRRRLCFSSLAVCGRLKLFSVVAGISIFTLKEVQLQRDPGYRNSSYPESGETLDCSAPFISSAVGSVINCYITKGKFSSSVRLRTDFLKIRACKISKG